MVRAPAACAVPHRARAQRRLAARYGPAVRGESSRGRATLDALRRLLLRESREQPLLLVFEDLHWADEATLDRLEGEGRVAFRYGETVNGSRRDIAGGLNEAGNVLGMMAHPERAIEPEHGSVDGRALFESAIQARASA